MLAARTDRNWTLMVLVTDGEEAGLMGAAALMTDRDVTSRLQAYINVEVDRLGGDADALRDRARATAGSSRRGHGRRRSPRGGSFALEIYKRLPNDTDFSILKRQDIPGPELRRRRRQLRVSHDARHAERLSPGTVRRTGEQVVAIVTALDAVDITAAHRADRTFFDIGGRAAASLRTGHRLGDRRRRAACSASSRGCG